MIEQMDTAKLNIDPETGDELPEPTTPAAIQTSHNYNLRPRPTERNKQYIIAQVGQQSTKKLPPKPHIHIMMTQMSMKEGIRKYGNKGNEA